MTTLKFRIGLAAVLSLGVVAANAGPLWSEETHEIAFGDFNHDSRTDMLYIAKNSSMSSGIILSSATGALDNPNQSWPSDYLGIPWHSDTYKPIVADFSGDGRDDILLQRQTPGDHYLLIAGASGQFTSIKQTIPNNTGSQLWSADSHRIIAGDFNGDGKKDLFLQSVSAGGLHAVFLSNPTDGTFSTAQQTWGDGQFGFGWSLSKANVYAGDFTGDGKDDLFVQGKPTIAIIDFEVSIPIPAYKPGSFGIMQAKVLSGSDIFYMPAFDTWDRMGKGGDWSGANYRTVVRDFNGDGRADVFLQGKSSAFPNRLALAGASGQLTSTDSLVDPTLRAFSSQQGRVHAVNFDGTGGFGAYLQASTSVGTNQYADTITSSTVSLLAHNAPAVSTPAPQTYQAFTAVARYNSGGQLTGTIAPDPDGATGSLFYAAVRNTYDTAGRLIKVETGELNTWFDDSVEPAAWTGFTVFTTSVIESDQYGRAIKKTTKGSDGIAFAAVQMSYNAIGQPLCNAIRMNPADFSSLPSDACQLGTVGSNGPDRITWSEFDIRNQLLRQKRGFGTSLEQTYISNTYAGRLLQTQMDANGNLSKLEYDSYARLSRRYYPSKTIPGDYNTSDYTQYTYDANGNLETERKRNGAVITYSNDALNRPTYKDLSDNTYSLDVNFKYDLRGLTLYSLFAANALDESGQGLKSDYDGFGRILKAHNTLSGADRILEYTYDRNGNRTSIKHPDGNFFAYKFDEINRLNEIKESDTTSLLKITYFPNGARKSITRMVSGATTNYHFDSTQRGDYFNQDLQGTADDLTNSFTYNSSSQITQLVQSNSLYAYVGSNNRPGNYVPNGLNQYATIGGQSTYYDVNGNLTADGGFGATYDMENHLVTTTGPGSTLKYDPRGRLYEFTVLGTPNQTTQLLYDGDALIAEYSGTGGAAPVVRRYVHGDRVDEPLLQYDGANLASRRFLHTDHQGSIVAQSDNSGAVIARYSYDVYGVAASTNADGFGYTGQYWLRSLDLYYYKARIYHPKLGRFLQTDPIGYKDDYNLYAYVGNDPLNLTDPLGLFPCIIGPCASGQDSYMGGFFSRAGDLVKGIADSVEVSASAGGQVGAEVNLGPIATVAVEVKGTERKLSTTPTTFFERDVRYTKISPAPGNSVVMGVKAKLFTLTLFEANNGEKKEMWSASPNVPNESEVKPGEIKILPSIAGPSAKAEVDNKDEDKDDWKVGATVHAGVASIGVKINLDQLLHPYDRSR